MSALGRVVVVGDALLDRDVDGTATRLAPDAPVPVVDEGEVRLRPGGAGLAAALAAGDGRDVTLVCALGTDAAADDLRAVLTAAGVAVLDLGLAGPTPEKVRMHAAGRPVMRLDRGGAGDPRAVGFDEDGARGLRTALEGAEAVLVADYGRGVAAHPGVRAALDAAVAAGTPVVWDPHPRGPAPVAGVALVTPNADEASRAAAGEDDDEARARALAATWGAEAVCVTRGAAGALLHGARTGSVAVAANAVAGDPCGAGDRFASRLAGALADGTDAEAGVRLAVAAATAFVAAGGAAGWRPTGPVRAAPRRFAQPRASADPQASLDQAVALAAATHARGGTVVATGGCFDLLHAGHVQTLQAARALGDVLVVLVNTDASVARLKGPDRPLNAAEDRAAVLSALGCVDAVATFAEDTPTAALAALRPDVWAKGGDYAGVALPEAPALESWGGRAVVLPHSGVDAHSTTRLIQEARCRPPN